MGTKNVTTKCNHSTYRTDVVMLTFDKNYMYVFIEI